MQGNFKQHRLVAVLMAAVFCAGPVLAEKDNGKGGGKQDKAEKHSQKNDDRDDDKGGKKAQKNSNNNAAKGQDTRNEDRRDRVRHDLPPGGYFTDRHRDSVRTYYVQQHGKACPPGLAKKRNGCMPPGHAKRWHVGQPLPRDVVYVNVPQVVLVRLPPQPQGYRYVGVGGDILLIGIGTLMVVDGIDGLLRM
jgi:Ni/Co efflux regulator RcnB